MRKLLYAILLGLIGAGIVHIVILILLPLFSRARRLVEACGSRRPLRHDGGRRFRRRQVHRRIARSLLQGKRLPVRSCRMARCGSRPTAPCRSGRPRSTIAAGRTCIISTTARPTGGDARLRGRHTRADDRHAQGPAGRAGIVDFRRGRRRRRHRRGARLRARRQLGVQNCDLCQVDRLRTAIVTMVAVISSACLWPQLPLLGGDAERCVGRAIAL